MENNFNTILNNNISALRLNDIKIVLRMIEEPNEQPEWIRNVSLWNKQVVKTKIKKYIKNFATNQEGEVRHNIPFHYDIIKKITFDVKKTQTVVLNLMKRHPGLKEIIFNEEDEFSIWPWWTSLITYLNIASKMIDYSFRNNKRILTLNELMNNYPKITDIQARNIIEAINKASKRDENWYENICNDIYVSRNVEYYVEHFLEQQNVLSVHRKYESYIEFISTQILDIINQITRNPHRTELQEDSDYFIFLSKNKKYVYFSEVEQVIDERYLNDFDVRLSKREALKWLIHEGIRCFTILFRWKDLIQWVIMINSYYSNTWMLNIESPIEQMNLEDRLNEFQGFVDSDSD